MNILAFDLSQTLCSVALSTGLSVFENTIEAPRKQAALVLEVVDNLIKKANITLSDIDLIGYSSK